MLLQKGACRTCNDLVQPVSLQLRLLEGSEGYGFVFYSLTKLWASDPSDSMSMLMFLY